MLCHLAAAAEPPGLLSSLAVVAIALNLIWGMLTTLTYAQAVGLVSMGLST